MARRLIAMMIGLSLITPMAGPAMAWKPKTHVYLAELAMRDAVDDGRVTIYQTDYATGRVVGTIGSFEANPAIVAALRARPAQYLAGVVGPDAYPDLMTGQQVIHPGTNLSLLGDPSHNEPASAAGTDAWLTYLWRLSYGRKDASVEAVRNAMNRGPLGEVAPPSDTPEIRAFVAGYLTHAAGDMFMHTFVNHYAGGDFALQPDPRNAIKHVVLEGYVGRRTPDTRAETSIEGVDDFIYRYMVRAYPGSVLEERLLRGGTSASLPYIFSNLRNGLQRDVDRYDRERLALRGPARVAYAATHGPQAEYKKGWIEGIDRGLRVWPRVSHEISRALVYNPAGGGTDVARARAAASAYMSDHVLSMSGVPDAAVATVQFIVGVIGAILPDILLAPLEALKRELLDYLVTQATGMTVDELKLYLDNPETSFDRVMNAPGGGYGGRTPVLMTLAEFNRSVLGIDDAGSQSMDRKFQVDRFAPAFNTVQMTKLLFLSERGMTDLLAALRAKGLTVPSMPTGVPYENAMLGFLTSMDGDNRWQGLAAGLTQASGRAFFLAQGGGEAWRNIFMPQIGERNDWPAASAPQQGTTPPDDANFQRIDQWAARIDTVTPTSGSGPTMVVSMTFRNDDNVPHTLSNLLVRPLRATLDTGAGAPVEAARMEYVNPDAGQLPQWHYPPHDMVPSKGRVSVRFVFDVGSAASRPGSGTVRIHEQRPRSPILRTQLVDGPHRDFPLPTAPAPADSATVGKGDQGDPPPVVHTAQLERYAGRFRTNRGTILTLKVEGQELVGEAMTTDRPRPAEVVRLRMAGDRLQGSMRTDSRPGQFIWFDLDIAFDPAAANFDGRGVYMHADSNPPISYSGQRISEPSAATGVGERVAGADGFQPTAWLEMKIDSVAHSSLGGVEVTLTARHDGDTRRGVQHDTQRYSILGSDGVEYGWDGNYYGSSSAEHPSTTVYLLKSQAQVTYVFPRIPAGVRPVRLLLRENGQQTASFELPALGENRP